jgi:lipopolysaccharide/colanic/teichoic acid biosynthesis glycosyltransferase
MKPLASTPLELDPDQDFGFSSSRLVTPLALDHEGGGAAIGGHDTVVDLRENQSESAIGLRSALVDERFRWALSAPSLADIREEGILVIRPYDRVKRVIDMVVAGVLLLACLPLLAILVMAIKIASPGTAIFAQERAGRGGKVFRCFKLRTMVPNADAVLQEVLARDPILREEFARKAKLTVDPRVYPLGGWLRRLSLDELPQLWNVVRGDMSLVGPRPLALRETNMYGSALWVVLMVRPGLTGIWQVSGRNDLAYDKRVALDVNYAKNHTFTRDMTIMLRTAPVLVRPGRSGAY